MLLRVIAQRAGELGHFDCKHLPNGMVEGFKGKLYLVGGIDDCTRVAWVELMTDITSLSTMFGAMGIMRLLQSRYNIRFERIMTDNGSEFKSNKTMLHPFERLLHQLSIKHIYTKPYKPQPNGKIERLWRTIYEECLEECVFESIDAFKEELTRYMLYYNEMRGHQSLNNKTPQEFRKELK
ncbi:hypothetical protein AGMMS49521_4040 [Campylobacterota bacterium]|nr:hypothetical protein AGMMS49521_4040 [Campylobacterota bacterium]